jgi:hypothetical protein
LNTNSLRMELIVDIDDPAISKWLDFRMNNSENSSHSVAGSGYAPE